MIKEDGTIVFEGAEQEKLNQIVEERLARERGKYADYEDLKGLDEELKAFGYQGTPKERRETIKAQREETQRQQELQELQQQAKTEGTSPELLKEIKELKKEISEIKGERQAKKTEEETKIKNQQTWDAQYKEWEEAFPDVDSEKLASDTKWKKFVKGKALPLKELYEDFIDFIGETETEAIKKTMSKASRSTSIGKGSNAGENHGLTASQIATVDDYNRGLPKKAQMSYSEFSQNLRR